MQKNYDVSAKVVCYENDEYSYADKEVKGLEVEFLKKLFNNSRFDGLLYILKNAKKIDILHVMHMTSTRNFYWFHLYKFLNPKGKAYLMVDYPFDLVNQEVLGKGIMKRYRQKQLDKVTLISVDTPAMAAEGRIVWSPKVQHVNNVCFVDYENHELRFEDKEDVIVYVGRHGTRQKNTEMLVEGFIRFAKEHESWRLKLIGSTTKEFDVFLQDKLDENSWVKDRIIVVNEIREKDKLYEELSKAKIFVSTARAETFAVATMEALYNGCTMVMSSVSGAFELTNNERYGRVYQIGDVDGLIDRLNEVADNEELQRRACYEGSEYVATHHSGDYVSATLAKYLLDN
ncbi:MAG: glycosyltransferase family 4 protein [Pseudobutyrivibrio sp.]|nr:glycosyltransferase family 4 protein [Pseudobutyrivibrio sp.]